MKHCVGLDVLAKETAIWVVEEADQFCREMKVLTDPADL